MDIPADVIADLFENKSPASFAAFRDLVLYAFQTDTASQPILIYCIKYHQEFKLIIRGSRNTILHELLQTYPYLLEHLYADTPDLHYYTDAATDTIDLVSFAFSLFRGDGDTDFSEVVPDHIPVPERTVISGDAVRAHIRYTKARFAFWGPYMGGYQWEKHMFTPSDRKAHCASCSYCETYVAESQSAETLPLCPLIAAEKAEE